MSTAKCHTIGRLQLEKANDRVVSLAPNRAQLSIGKLQRRVDGRGGLQPVIEDGTSFDALLVCLYD